MFFVCFFLMERLFKIPRVKEAKVDWLLVTKLSGGINQ